MISRAASAIVSHDTSSRLESVTKSAVMNTLVTPSSATSSAAMGSSMSAPATKVCGGPTSVPTENFNAFGFGVFWIVTGIGSSWSTTFDRSGRVR